MKQNNTGTFVGFYVAIFVTRKKSQKTRTTHVRMKRKVVTHQPETKPQFRASCEATTCSVEKFCVLPQRGATIDASTAPVPRR